MEIQRWGGNLKDQRFERLIELVAQDLKSRNSYYNQEYPKLQNCNLAYTIDKYYC